MTRTQLILEPWQLEALRSTAEREGGSISSVVRRILTAALGSGADDPQAAPQLADLDGVVRDAGFSARHHDAELHDLYGRIARRTARGATSPARDSGGASYGAPATPPSQPARRRKTGALPRTRGPRTRG